MSKWNHLKRWGISSLPSWRIGKYTDSSTYSDLLRKSERNKCKWECRNHDYNDRRKRPESYTSWGKKSRPNSKWALAHKTVASWKNKYATINQYRYSNKASSVDYSTHLPMSMERWQKLHDLSTATQERKLEKYQNQESASQLTNWNPWGLDLLEN